MLKGSKRVSSCKTSYEPIILHTYSGNGRQGVCEYQNGWVTIEGKVPKRGREKERKDMKVHMSTVFKRNLHKNMFRMNGYIF